MKLETLRCNHCGGPLTVPESANFVTCNHCNSQLAIRRTDSTTFTEELGEIKANQKQMIEQLASIQRQNRLEQIDRDWEREREKYMVTHKSGRKSEPSEIGSIVGGLVIGFFGIFWTGSVLSARSSSPFGGPPIFFVFFGILFTVLGIGGGIYSALKAKDFRAAQKRYQRRRSEAFEPPSSADDRYGRIPEIPTPEEYLNRIEREDNE